MGIKAALRGVTSKDRKREIRQAWHNTNINARCLPWQVQNTKLFANLPLVFRSQETRPHQIATWAHLLDASDERKPREKVISAVAAEQMIFARSRTLYAKAMLCKFAHATYVGAKRSA